MTREQRRILAMMRDKKLELVFEHGACYVGYERVSKRSLLGLLHLMALRADSSSTVGGFERYTIGQTGLDLLAEAEEKRRVSEAEKAFVERRLGDAVICSDCQAIVRTFAKACTAGEEDCPGWWEIELALMDFESGPT